MQLSVFGRIFKRNRPILDEAGEANRNRRNGIIGVLVIGAVLATTGVAYVSTNGTNTYTANLHNSGGLRAGDDVRIAGISVGKVTSVRVDKALVEAKFTVDQSVQVGSDSRIDIKLLTPLGGHYVALDPNGDVPLGHNVIPPHHTTVPFEINDIFQEFTPVVKKVDGKVIHDTVMEVANAANKYPNGLRDFFTRTTELIKSLTPTSDDFHDTLTFANEYLRAFAAGKMQLAKVIGTIAHLGDKFEATTTDIIEVFATLKEIVRIFSRIFKAYARDYEPMLNGLDDIVDSLTQNPDRLGRAAEQWGQLVGIVLPMLSGNGITITDDRVIPGQDVCLPHFFRFC